MLRIVALTLFALLVAVITALDATQGAVQAVAWACRTLGSETVAVTAAFLAGCAITHAAHRGLAARRKDAA